MLDGLSNPSIISERYYRVSAHRRVHQLQNATFWPQGKKMCEHKFLATEKHYSSLLMNTRMPVLFSPQPKFHSGYISQTLPYFPFQVASGFLELQNVLSCHFLLTSTHLSSSPTHRVNEGLKKMSGEASACTISIPLRQCDLLCEQKWLLSQRKLSSEPLRRKCIHSRCCKICKINTFHICVLKEGPLNYKALDPRPSLSLVQTI